MSSTSLSWAHGVNADSALRLALSNPNVDALEFDVSYNVHHNVPVLRHASKSELTDLSDEFTLAEFLTIFFSSERRRDVKVLKFDFKALDAVPEALNLLSSSSSSSSSSTDEADVEYWFNADVVSGPGTTAENDKLVDPHVFLPTCALRFPRATLSLGWTTDFSFVTTYAYERRHLEDMLGVINTHAELLQGNTITFAMRASLMKPSFDAISQHLLDQDSFEVDFHKTSSFLTVWSGVEGVPESDLHFLREKTPSRIRVEFDVDKGSKRSWYHITRLYSYPKDAVEYLMST